MKLFIFIICIYIYIIAYNIYVPDGNHYASITEEGIGVGIFFAVSSLIALLSLNNHFEKRNKLK